MDYYKAKVRLSGSMLNEVWKDRLSAPEVLLLRKIHGSDAVCDLEKVDAKKVDHQEERQRLYLTYPAAINVDAKRHYVEELFGPNHNDLPVTVPGVAITPKKGGKEVNVEELME